MKSVVSASIADNFVRLLPRSPNVESVFWDWEGDVLRVWTIISERSIELQHSIYDAESKFLDAFPDRPADFSVVFREGRSLREIVPSHAHEIAFLED